MARTCTLLIAGAVWLASATSSYANPQHLVVPTDVQDSGTLAVAGELSNTRRTLDIDGSPGVANFALAAIDARMFGPGMWFGVRADYSLRRDLELDGMSVPVDDRKLRSVTLDTGTVLLLGDRYRLGANAALTIPSIGLEGLGFELAALGSVELSPATSVFSRAGYKAHFAEAGLADVGRARVGLHRTFDKLSLVPSVALSRTAADDVLRNESFFVFEADMALGYSITSNLTVLAALNFQTATEHAISSTQRGSARDLRGTTSLVYAVDLSPLPRSGGHADPATISLDKADTPPAVATFLRRRIPALRAATLAAETDDGVGHGVFEIELSVAEDGRVSSVNVASEGGALAAAVHRFYERETFPVQQPADYVFAIRFAP